MTSLILLFWKFDDNMIENPDNPKCIDLKNAFKQWLSICYDHVSKN